MPIPRILIDTSYGRHCNRKRLGAVLIFFAVALSTSDAPAQERAGISRMPVSAGYASTTLELQRRYSGPARLGSAVGGWLAGTIAGGFLGYQMLPHTCKCDDPGLDQMIYGAFTGGAIGAGLGAALPGVGSVCSSSTRIGRSLAGAAVGAAAGFIVGGGFQKGQTSLILVPIGSVGGGLGALGRCWNSRDT